jgi:hypothetical protein
MSEINNNFFCSAGYDDPECNGEGDCIERAIYSEHTCQDCNYLHHKWPTLKQYQEEYGRELQSNDAVYFLAENDPYPGEEYAQWWQVEQYCEISDMDEIIFVVACTPFGRPDDGWRPEGEKWQKN